MDGLEEIEKNLRARIIAPCCFKQTLDVHASPEADRLRREIRERLAAGDSSEDIMADLVRRYGDGVLTKPMPSGVAAALIGGAALLSVWPLLVLWRRRTLRPTANDAPTYIPDDPELQDRLEDELAADV